MAPRFPATRWSLVDLVSDPSKVSTPASREALETLCRNYRLPLLRFTLERGYSQEDAEDLVQSFFVNLLKNNTFGQADPEKGRLRNYLLTALKHHLNQQWKRRTAQKRGGQLEFISSEETGTLSSEGKGGTRNPEESFDYHWACTLLENTLQTLRDLHASKGDLETFETLSPFLTDNEPQAFDAACRHLGVSANTGRVRLHRMRGRLRRIFSQQVSATLAEGESLEEEIGYLENVLRT